MSDRRLADEEVGAWRVSTIRLGVTEGIDKLLSALGQLPSGGAFETMVFPLGSFDDRLCLRYEDAESALKGHAWVVGKLREGVALDEIGRPE